MTEVCHDVQVEPHLLALSGEVMHHRSAVLDDDARVDIRAAAISKLLCIFCQITAKTSMVKFFFTEI